MKKLITITIACAGTLLASCASTGLTKLENEASISAPVRFASADKGPGTLMGGGPVLAVRKYDDADCTTEQTIAKLRNGPFGGASSYSLDIPLADFHKNASSEIYMLAGKDTTFLVQFDQIVGNTSYSCGVIFTTRFDLKKSYELSGRGLDTVTGYQNCYVDIFEIVGGENGPERKLIETFDNSAKDVTPACRQAFSKMRWI